ncbi:hypothetical protein C1H46_031139 [Malus baccata]|uniref:DUF4378 domain-containing protein n=1 Tax=Malus baccata TaxID=106549 RepID=A0A540LAJ0_MALBA|nr:hypothetical protein C1H46_031139 [Malus baccata]
MSAKILHSLKDENRDLHKQIGCMSGIFQLFDRHHFLAGRRINAQNHKRLPPGENCNHAVEPRTVQKATEKIRKKAVKEKQRNSTESSKTTVASSSCSSSFSSLEHQKAAEQETSLSGQTISNDNYARDLSLNQPNVLMHIRRRSVDLQDLVKDSTYREARGISVKPAAKDGAGHALKYIDSPRPSPIKSTKTRFSGGNESLQVPGKLRVAPWSSNEEKDGGTRFLPKDARRFSYDGRESRYASKSTVKLKEVPRLSLDSKERSIRRGCNPETKANYFIKDLQREYGNSNKMLDLQHEPGSTKRPSNVVAKLMGLDLSDSVSTTDNIRTNTMPSDLQPKPDEKLQRKLVFEVINEFLVQKLVVEDSLKQWFPPHKLADWKPRSQQLLKELCSEVDQLQRKNLNGSLDDEDESLRNILLEDFTDQAKNWTECDSEIPGVVLDVERLIFKDLINEIVSGDSVSLHGWSSGHYRQLFSEKGLC